MRCEQCNNEFEGRADARFCSSTCRSRHSRATDNEISVATDNYATDKMPEVVLDLVKDLKLDLGKHLGITAWTKDGIFIRDDITEEQVRNIRKLVSAKNGWPVERDMGVPRRHGT